MRLFAQVNHWPVLTAEVSDSTSDRRIALFSLPSEPEERKGGAPAEVVILHRRPRVAADPAFPPEAYHDYGGIYEVGSMLATRLAAYWLSHHCCSTTPPFLWHGHLLQAFSALLESACYLALLLCFCC